MDAALPLTLLRWADANLRHQGRRQRAGAANREGPGAEFFPRRKVDLFRLRSNRRLAGVESARQWRSRNAAHYERRVCGVGIGRRLCLLLEVQVSAAGNL